MKIEMSKGLRLGFFGSFYPFADRLGSASTSMVTLLKRSPMIEKITVFAPYSAKMMDGESSAKVEIVECWKYDDPISLLETLSVIHRRKSDFDYMIFNICVTSFGKSRISNVLGLLMPTISSKLFKIPTTVYMHNLVETQDISNLGYRSSFLARTVAFFLERFLLRWCRVIMPLESQKKIAEEIHKRRVYQLQIPYLEAIASNLLAAGVTSSNVSSQKPKVLLFGSWGPQKDLESGLGILKELLDEGLDFEVKIVGKTNSNFPGYMEKFKAIKESFSSGPFSFVGEVDESMIEGIFSSANVLFLPYNGAGGYSGVMNIGALYGLRMIAYDVPQLREFSQSINANTRFVNKENRDELKTAFRQSLLTTAIMKPSTLTLSDKLKSSEGAVTKLINIISEDVGSRYDALRSSAERE